MAKGSKREKGLPNVLGRPGKVMDTTVKELGEQRVTSIAAAQLGKLGGVARARSLTSEQRTEIARKAAAKRWGKA